MLQDEEWDSDVDNLITGLALTITGDFGASSGSTTWFGHRSERIETLSVCIVGELLLGVAVNKAGNVLWGMKR